MVIVVYGSGVFVVRIWRMWSLDLVYVLYGYGVCGIWIWCTCYMDMVHSDSLAFFCGTCCGTGGGVQSARGRGGRAISAVLLMSC